MPLTSHASPFAFALVLATLPAAAIAQSTPRRDNIETVAEGDAARDILRDRHVLEVSPAREALVAVEGGPVLDLEMLAGDLPEVWASHGGALLVRQPPSPVADGAWTVDTGAYGARWVRLRSLATTRTLLHLRQPAKPADADPWRVPVKPQAATTTRTRAGHRDQGVAVGHDPVAYPVSTPELQLEVWRAQEPRPIPPDATWLRVAAGDRLLHEGPLPTPAAAERGYRLDDCHDTLDLAGRLHLQLPSGVDRIEVRGEPGTWLKVMAPLPGTPVSALAREEEGAPPASTEAELEASFVEAVRAFPDGPARVFLARHGYQRAVAVRPGEGMALQSREWRPRLPTMDAGPVRPLRGTTRPGATTPTATFHWVPAGGQLRFTTAVARPALLRVIVAHPASQATAQLRLDQRGQPPVDLALDPAAVQALRHAHADNDGFLALETADVPIVDASQVTLPRADGSTPSVLRNTGQTGAWVALEQRVPAFRAQAPQARDAFLPLAKLRQALLGVDPAPDAASRALAATRDMDQARRLLLARAVRFREDPCVVATQRGQSAANALQALAQSRGLDPVLARCAALQAFALAPEDAEVRNRFDAWADGAGQPGWRTSAYAWALLDPLRGADPALWSGLASALEAEAEPTAAWLVRHAAGATPHLPDGTASESRQVPADTSGGFSLALSGRKTYIPFALADAAFAADWSRLEPGLHTLELRSPASTWVQVGSGSHRWWTWVPGADQDDDALTDVAHGQRLGRAVTIPFQVPVAGASLAVSSRSGTVWARVTAEAGTTASAGRPGGSVHVVPVRGESTQACQLAPWQAALQVHQPAPPMPRRSPVAVVPAAGAALAGDTVHPATAVQAALAALLALRDGNREDAQAWAAKAYLLREADPGFDVGGVFAALARHVRWTRITPSGSGARRARMVADGRSTQPLTARRERWAGIDDDEAFVLRPGQHWQLDGLRPGQPVQLALTARSPLSGGLDVRTSQRFVHRLRHGERIVLRDQADAAGALRLQLSEALPGTFVTLELSDAEGAPLDGRRPLAYHAGPLTLALSAPTVLRVIEWDGLRSSVRLQPVDAAGNVRVTAQQRNAALRVLAMRLDNDTPDPQAETAPQSWLPVIHPGGAAQAVPAPDPGVRPAADAWPARWPSSGGEDGTWGLLAGWQQRTDPDDAEDRRERFTEGRWRWRGRLPAGMPAWARIDLVGRRHDNGARVWGLQHDLHWRMADGPWGVRLEADAWYQPASATLRAAHAATVRGAVEWNRSRDDRWRDEWDLGLRWRSFSSHHANRGAAASLDNDVYSRYRADHRRQLDFAYRTVWRSRYDSEWLLGASLAGNDLADGGIDQVGGQLGWRWTRHGWTASGELDLRRHLADRHRRVASSRQRLELSIGKWWLGADHGWRLRATAGYDTRTRSPRAGLVVEWFDHDGRALEDIGPNEMFLRSVIESDLFPHPEPGERP